MGYLIFLLVVVVFIGVIYRFRKVKKVEIDSNINEWSFQRYAKFYGNMVLRDDKFQQKMEKICYLVLTQEEEDIKFIAKESGCTYEECILKIRYLKNKRKIGDLYIDYINGLLKKCSPQDQRLLDIYKHFLYTNHFQIDEMAIRMPQTSSLNIEQVKNKIFDDLCYLDDKGLINGIILNKVDKKIVYYSIEKHKNDVDFVSINCPNCGAINDVNKGSKIRCEYCDTIISAPKERLYK